MLRTENKVSRTRFRSCFVLLFLQRERGLTDVRWQLHNFCLLVLVTGRVAAAEIKPLQPHEIQLTHQRTSGSMSSCVQQ